ncbi:DUF4364 family protein [Alkaliphilus peptidifermentans]|uniref:DUF4364 domain-containing protein n=1 Tax=Alkaliphilus peptidifermentans DSM 18978 TaxID=1120976 RepID=A0A1G5I204_9FIRM|nr:DUF4364 family protein [Alkaliphilus peptidifermentans]SCY69719.1 protein of unknown function [Alkaliphilus peptidifermentans DSM 18978]
MFVNSSQQLAENKLLLLYIFKKLDLPVTHSQVTDFILKNDIMNYFMFQQFLGELKESDFIEEEHKDNIQYYVITEKGRNTLKYFIDRIPPFSINKINQMLGVARNEFIKSSEVKADYIKLNEMEYLVSLKVIENEQPIIHLDLNVANSKQAKQICENWRNNAQNLYGKLINLLIE